LEELFDRTKGQKIAIEEKVAVEKYCGREGIAVETGVK